MGTLHGESAVWVRDRAARTRLGVYPERENVLGVCAGPSRAPDAHDPS